MAIEPVRVDSLEVAVQISVGLTLRKDGGEPLALTLARADRNLYRAKREGRNRIEDTQE